MIKTNNHIRVTASSDGGLKTMVGSPVPRRSNIVTSSIGSQFGNNLVGMGSGSSGAIYDTMMSNLVGDNEITPQRWYSDIYHYDSIAGSAVDLMSTMPFSEITLAGCENEERLATYNSALERLNLQTVFPEIARDMLVNGGFTGTPIHQSQSGKFVDIIAWQRSLLTITPSPFMGSDPIIRATPSEELRRFMSSNEPHFKEMRRNLNQTLIEALKGSEVELDPLTTIFIPRKTFSYDHTGTSLYKRILPFYLIEKSLYRGTLVEAGRRQRSMLHVPMGDDSWDPTPDEMSAVVSLFQQADLDPLGAIVGTRSGVSPSELRQGGDFWKWTDIIESTASMKMRALGISESFLSGDATYASMEVSLSVFVENLRAFRTMITHRLFYNKLFPLIAYSHGFMKKGKKQLETKGIELKHQLNDATMLDIPRVHWQKALRPEADKDYLDVLATLKANGVPVTLAAWATAGGMTTEQLLSELKAEQKLVAQIKEVTGKDPTLTPEEAQVIASGRFSNPTIPLMSRNFDSFEYKGVTPTGKPTVISQVTARNESYSALEKVVRDRQRNPDKHLDIINKVTKRMGKVPSIY